MKKVVSRGEEIYSSDVFDVLLQYEIARSRRYPAPLALIQIEIRSATSNQDELPNTSVIFAAKLNAILRSVDIPSAAAEKAFNILMPTTSEAGTRAVCERILSIFKNNIIGSRGEVVAFSLQIGASCHPGGESLSSEGLFQKASEALQQSKLKGPNTFVLIST